MTKEHLLKLTPKEAFNHGVKSKSKGFSEHYNPYRNFSDKKICSLSNAWELGYKSID